MPTRFRHRSSPTNGRLLRASTGSRDGRAGQGVTLLPSPPRIPLVRQRPAFLQSRHLSGSDAATAVKGAQRDRSHTQPQGRMARTSPLTAGGRGGAPLYVGCEAWVVGSAFRHSHSVKFREGVDGNALFPIGLMKVASGKSGNQRHAGGTEGGGHRLGCICVRAICYHDVDEAL
jgi:hypothetical protein